MSCSDIVSIDAIRRTAKAAAERGTALHDACPWPFASEAGQRFKREFIFHKAALEALTREPQQ